MTDTRTLLDKDVPFETASALQKCFDTSTAWEGWIITHLEFGYREQHKIKVFAKGYADPAWRDDQ